MARITVEDCLDKVDNRFELVMVSSKRARQIQTGGKDAMVSEDNDKPTVIALREIADGFVDAGILVEKPSMELEESIEEPSENQPAQESVEPVDPEDKLTAGIDSAEPAQAGTSEQTEADAKEESTPPEE